jgi:uncharacterized membrane protein HdeD (DUF308 family)
MLDLLTRNWWLVALRGLLAILFGILALVWPQVTLEALILFFGAYALLDGLFTLFSALTARRRYEQWIRWVVFGLLGFVLGLLVLVWPRATSLVLVFLIAARALLVGVFEIIAAVELRREITGEWLLGLSGILSVAFGVLLLIWPGSGIVALAWLIGIYAILFGVLLVVLAFRLRGWSQTGAEVRA